MPNTPTESEFDKELDKIFDDYVMIGETFSTNPKNTKDIPYLKKAIKQAVDKHVIGEDSQDNQMIVHYPGGVISHGGRVKEYGPSVSSGANIFSVTNNKLRAEQRKALYSQDKSNG